MLKIEVIRFEAEDVITASVETPVVPEQKPEVVCTCPSGVDHYSFDNNQNTVWNHEGCPVDDIRHNDHNCNDYIA